MTHLSFPIRLDTRGRTALVTDEAYLRELIEQVLFTRPGERVNRPDFGSGVDQLVFAPSGDELAHTTHALVQGALQTWLGDLMRIDQVQVRAEDGRLEVTIVYTPVHAAAGSDQRVVRVTRGTP